MLKFAFKAKKQSLKMATFKSLSKSCCDQSGIHLCHQAQSVFILFFIHNQFQLVVSEGMNVQMLTFKISTLSTDALHPPDRQTHDGTAVILDINGTQFSGDSCLQVIQVLKSVTSQSTFQSGNKKKITWYQVGRIRWVWYHVNGRHSNQSQCDCSGVGGGALSWCKNFRYPFGPICQRAGRLRLMSSFSLCSIPQ